eukprot:TRINITY_DN23875_c0_g1_i1.p1 TRINITY_DN23875_c0_g1~~TRINITY_DN23875_c0_g1_i1.p1  ORF type:complete len:631 (-),score=99.86 TRINITY_DN23875_c0_g1_i1:137-2029(-)
MAAKSRSSLLDRFQKLQEKDAAARHASGPRRSVSDAINAPGELEDNSASSLLSLFEDMRRQAIGKNIDELAGEGWQDADGSNGRIWYIEGTIPNKGCFLRFGSSLDLLAFQMLRCISLLDTIAVPMMLTFGRVTWLAHLKVLFPIVIRIDVLVGICYLLGTARRLITSTVDLEQAKEFVELKAIRQREIRKYTFWCDVLSMPGHLWWMDGCRVLCAFRLLRCWRVMSNERDRCYQIATGKIENVRSTIIKLAFYLALVAHCFACAWFYAVMWPFDDMQGLVEVNAKYWGSDLFSQYIATLAGGMAMLVGWSGPSAPHPDGFTNVELVYNAVASPIAGVFQAYVVGGLLLALERAAHESDKFLHKMDNIGHVMASLGLPVDTRKRVIKYQTFLNLHNIEKDAFASLFDGLSTHLHKEIQLIMYESLIVSAPFLKKVPVDVLVKIVTAFNNEVFSPGDTIVRKGEIGQELFFVVKGSCQVLADFEGTTVLAEKHCGDYFGEVAIVMDTRRNAWIKAKTFCVLAVLPKLAFDEAVQPYPLVKEIMIKRIIDEGRHGTGNAPSHANSPTNTTPLLKDSTSLDASAAVLPPLPSLASATEEPETLEMLKAMQVQLTSQIRRLESKERLTAMGTSL